VHGLRCYGNITRTRNVSEYILVLALSLVVYCFSAVTVRFTYFIIDNYNKILWFY